MNQKNPDKNRGLGRDIAANDPLGNNSEIGRKLKQYYDELLTPDVPDRFSKLLQELEKHELPQSATEE
ncbi:NepR family anti-sigma factor [Nitratireductor aestuarii]|nr:NepR family anti-sigma factor [Nitratireductor aestuarii]